MIWSSIPIMIGIDLVIFLLILSASMSTLAALVLISGSTIVQDLYKGFLRPDASDRRLTTSPPVAGEHDRWTIDSAGGRRFERG